MPAVALTRSNWRERFWIYHFDFCILNFMFLYISYICLEIKSTFILNLRFYQQFWSSQKIVCSSNIGVSGTIYVNIYSSKLGFPYLNFFLLLFYISAMLVDFVFNLISILFWWIINSILFQFFWLTSHLWHCQAISFQEQH